MLVQRQELRLGQPQEDKRFEKANSPQSQEKEPTPHRVIEKEPTPHRVTEPTPTEPAPTKISTSPKGGEERERDYSESQTQR